MTTVELEGGKHDGQEVEIPTLSGVIEYDGQKYRNSKHNWHKPRGWNPWSRCPYPTAIYTLIEEARP